MSLKITEVGKRLLEAKAEEAVLFQRLHAIAQSDCHILVEKGRSYGDSWKKRGGVGAFMMLARKWDRIENIVQRDGWDVFSSATHNEGDILDDIRDLRRYLLLVEDHVMRDPWREMAPVQVDGFEKSVSDAEDAEILQSMAEHAASIRSQHD